MIELLNIDCMEYMRAQPDKAFDLAIVDPPYFSGPEVPNYFRSNMRRKGRNKHHKKIKEWANQLPTKAYFDELFRTSRRQIIWGCNYYAHLIPHKSRIVWDKVNDNTPYSQAELASYSEGLKVYMYRYRWNGMMQADMKNKENRIHPTQKPVRLYQWLLNTFAKSGQRILDTHLGSASSAIAAHYFGCDFVGCELDQHYFTLAKQRFDQETRQTEMDLMSA